MTAKETTTRLTVLTALRDAIDAEVTEIRKAATAELADLNNTAGVRQLDVTLPDGTKVASVTLTNKNPKPTVWNEDEFLTWVKQNHPTEVMEVVRPSWQRALLDACDIDGDAAIHRVTGEVIPGVGPAGQHRPGLLIRWKRDTGRGDTLAAIRDARVAVDIPMLPSGQPND